MRRKCILYTQKTCHENEAFKLVINKKVKGFFSNSILTKIVRYAICAQKKYGI